MMPHRTWLVSSVLGCVIALGLASAAQADGRRFEVTITNLTAHQVFTPIMVASHREGVQLFTLGQPASVELEILAEAGDTGPLSAALAARPDVLDVTTGAPLPAGQSQTIFVGTRGDFDHVSVAAMLVPTNDGFFAINGVEGPEGNEGLTLFSVAYDAGTEANDELCAHIPGPPGVCAGEGFNPSRAGAEGFVHVHRGIHGAGDLSASVWDWRNPVAKITIRRVP
jgi:spondin N